MIFIAGRLWDHFLMISEAVVKREGKDGRRKDKRNGERFKNTSKAIFGSSNKSRRSAILKRK